MNTSDWFDGRNRVESRDGPVRRSGVHVLRNLCVRPIHSMGLAYMPISWGGGLGGQWGGIYSSPMECMGGISMVTFVNLF